VLGFRINHPALALASYNSQLRVPVPGSLPSTSLRSFKPLLKVSDLLNVAVKDVALGGKGVARHEGKVVFVDGGFPGDEAQVRITRVHRDYAEGRVELLQIPSKLRVNPPCPHVPRCGGCRLQGLEYGAQLEIKERQVRDALERIGGLREPRCSNDPAGALSRSTTGTRWSSASIRIPPDEPILGLHERGTFDRVFPLETCLLTSALAVEIVRFTQRFATRNGWLAYHPARHQGVVRFLTVRHLTSPVSAAST
jgi:23S rRNA (uracil1939-C5)-methyltransferase